VDVVLGRLRIALKLFRHLMVNAKTFALFTASRKYFQVLEPVLVDTGSYAPQYRADVCQIRTLR
jgi:hypothetical protein